MLSLSGGVIGIRFENGMTYYVTSEIGLYGTTTFEGGSIIKFDEQNGGFEVYSAINNSTDPPIPPCSPA